MNQPFQSSPSDPSERSVKLVFYIVIIVCLVGARITYLVIHEHDKKIDFIARKDAEAIRAVPVPPPVAALAQPSLVLELNRAWLKRKSSSMFDFTDSEWQALTNGYPEKVVSPASLSFAQGSVSRVSTAQLKSMIAAEPSAMQTNAVWFYR